MLGHLHSIQAISQNCSRDEENPPLICVHSFYDTIFSIKTAADKGKGSAAAHGLAKLNIFNSGAISDYETDRPSKQSYAIFGKAMKVMLEKPRAACKAASWSLAKMAFDLARN